MQPPVKMRKNAKQARAKQSVSAILEATTQLLGLTEIDQISTNHIAERAGVSIGTLYQYFPNKTAIFVAIAEQDIERRFKLVAEAILKADGALAEDATRGMMRAFIRSFADAKHNAAIIKVLMATRATAEARDFAGRWHCQTLGGDGGPIWQNPPTYRDISFCPHPSRLVDDPNGNHRCTASSEN
jgi:AcrR family transcriptional regulator